MRSAINIPLCSTWQLLPYLALLDDFGVQWQTIAGRLGLPTSCPDAANFISTPQYCRFLAEITRREAIPDLAVRANLGRVGRLHIWQPVPRVMSACLSAPTLNLGLREICETANTQSTSLSLWLMDKEQHTWLCSTSSSVSGIPGCEQTEQARVLQIVALVQRFLGFEWQPLEVHLQSRAQPEALFSEVLGGPRIFTARPHTALPIPKPLLSTPGSVRQSPLAHHGNESNASDTTQWDWLQRLRAILPTYVLYDQPTLETVAEIASVHLRTLQRALAAEGLSFREMLEQARYEVARQRLADSSMTVAEISQLLGYTEPTNFSRAFRRISGRTPSQYRTDLVA